MALSGQHKNSGKIQVWLDDCSSSFSYEVNHHIKSIVNGGPFDPRFLFYTQSELVEYFESIRFETELLAVLNLIAATEAAIRVDYVNRVERRDGAKGELYKAFKDLKKRKKERVSLEDDILQHWKECVPLVKARIDEFQSILKYRHWLAHGRYWVFKKGIPPSFVEVRNLVDKMIDGFSKSEFKFFPIKI